MSLLFVRVLGDPRRALIGHDSRLVGLRDTLDVMPGVAVLSVLGGLDCVAVAVA